MFDIALNKIKESEIFNPAKRALQPALQMLSLTQNKMIAFRNSVMPTPTFYDKYANKSQAIISHCPTVS